MRFHKIFYVVIAIVAIIIAGFVVAQELGVPLELTKRAVATLVPVPHRLQPLHTPAGVLIIDDSYNGNPEGVREALRALGRFSQV